MIKNQRDTDYVYCKKTNFLKYLFFIVTKTLPDINRNFFPWKKKSFFIKNPQKVHTEKYQILHISPEIQTFP